MKWIMLSIALLLGASCAFLSTISYRSAEVHEVQQVVTPDGIPLKVEKHQVIREINPRGADR